MRIYSLNISQNFKGLVPISEYKGPVLKLTQAEKSEIQSLESEIAKLTLEKDQILDYSKTVNSSPAFHHKLMSSVNILDREIEYYQDLIKEIKEKRIAKQRKKFNK